MKSDELHGLTIDHIDVGIDDDGTEVLELCLREYHEEYKGKILCVAFEKYGAPDNKLQLWLQGSVKFAPRPREEVELE